MKTRLSQGGRRPLLAPAVVAALAYVGMLALHWRTGTLRDAQTPITLAWWLLAFAAFALALWRAERMVEVSWAWIWLPAIVFRGVLIFTTPTLSDDVYRYLWDGHLINQGVSPYLAPVDSSQLDAFAIPLRGLVNHAWMASPYLPAAQALFATAARALPLAPASMQVVMTALDLINGLLIAGLLRVAGLPPRRLLLYLWHPLVVVEVAHAAHIDAWMITLTLGASWLLLAHGATARSGLVLALAALVKPLPALLTPIFFARAGWRFASAFVATVLALLIPVGWISGWGARGPLDGRGLFGALRIYADQWRFNSGLFHWLAVALERLGVAQPDRWAKVLVGLALALILLWAWRAARREEWSRGLLRIMAVPFMAYALLTPTMHPWYLLALLAYLPFVAPGADETAARWRLLAPWLYLSVALIFSYLTYLDPNDFRELAWVRMLEWIPTLGLLVWVALTRDRGLR